MHEAVVLRVARSVQRKIRSLARRTRNSVVHARCRVVVAMTWARSIAVAADHAAVALSTGYRTVKRYREGGLDAIKRVRAGRWPYKVTVEVALRLVELVDTSPNDHGWATNRWSSELLAKQLVADTGVTLHPSHIRRLLKKAGIVYRRPAPYIRRVDPHKKEKLAAIRRLLDTLPADELVP